MTTNQTIDGDKLAVPLTAEQFVKGYCERSGISLSEFYEAMVPMPDPRSPAGWAAVSNNPLCVKAHVELYSPEASKSAAQANGEPVADALSTGFYMTETGGGKYAINIGFRSMAEMQAADQQLRDLLRSRHAEQPAPAAVVLPERSNQDYAIEHAEYMAKSADEVLAKFQAYGLALLAVDEGGDDCEDELLENIDSARGDLQESLVELRSLVYEFRKRSAKSR